MEKENNSKSKILNNSKSKQKLSFKTNLEHLNIYHNISNNNDKNLYSKNSKRLESILKNNIKAKNKDKKSCINIIERFKIGKGSKDKYINKSKNKKKTKLSVSKHKKDTSNTKSSINKKLKLNLNKSHTNLRNNVEHNIKLSTKRKNLNLKIGQSENPKVTTQIMINNYMYNKKNKTKEKIIHDKISNDNNNKSKILSEIQSNYNDNESIAKPLNLKKKKKSITKTLLKPIKNVYINLLLESMPELPAKDKFIIESIKENKKLITKLNFYKNLKIIGRGSFGRVYLFSHKLSNRLVACKVLEKQTQKDESLKKKIQMEVGFLKVNLGHPGVLKIMEIFENLKYVFFVTEYLPGGDLLTLLKKENKIKEEKAKYIFLQLALTLKFIHGNGILHRDIKLDNVLLDEKGDVRICDFGVSRYMKKGVFIDEQCGTPAYLAPEIIKEKYKDFKADVWSLGVLMYSLVTGSMPFKANSIDDLHKLILEGEFNSNELDSCSDNFKDLITNMLKVDYNERYDISDCIKHEWTEFKKQSVNNERIIKILDFEKYCNNYLDIDKGNKYIVNEYAICKCEKLGFSRNFIIESIKNKELNHGSVTYYCFEKDFL